MKLPAQSASVAMAFLALCCPPPANAAEWTTTSTSRTYSVSYCLANGAPSCWVTYTESSVSYQGHFGSRQEAATACGAMLKSTTCHDASGEPGPSHMSGGWEITCPSGLNQYGYCTSTLRRYVTAYYYPVIIEQDVERPPDCADTGRQFGNPIDGLTGEKHEQVTLGRWSSQAPPLTLHYRSGRFARQLGISTFKANNIPGLPGTAGPIGLGIPDGAGAMPFGPLWTHGLDTRITTGTGHARLHRMAGGGGLSFRSGTTGNLMLPPPDQADRLLFMGGGGASWLHRDPRHKRTHYFSATGMLVHVVNADGTGRQWLTYSDSATPPTVAAGPDRLLAVRDAFGRQLRVRYIANALGQATDLIADVTDDEGHPTVFEYDPAQRLSAVRWPDGTMQRFTYDAALPWALSARIDEAGVANGRWTWNPATGLVTSTSKADGTDWHVLRFAKPPQVAVTDTIEGRVVRRRYSWQPGIGAEVTLPNSSTVGLGTALRHGSLQLERRSQPAGAGCDASQSAMVLDDSGNPTVKDDFAGARTCHAYDTARKLEIVRVEGLDRSANCTALLAPGAPLPPGARKISTRWHPVWPIAEMVASAGQIETRVYNDRPDPFAAGSTARCMPWLYGGDVPNDVQPAALCRQVRRATTDTNGSRGFSAALDPAVPPREDRWTYTAQGQPLSHDGPRTDVADVTTWRYHGTTTANARAGDLAEVRNGIGQATRFDAWSPSGLLLAYRDVNDVATRLSYDRRQRLVRIEEAAGTPWGRQTLQTWDARGLLRSTERPAWVASNAAGVGGNFQQQRVRYEYDRAHRLIGRFSDSGQGVSYELDPAGQVLSRSIHHGGNLSSRPTVQQYEHDALGRVQRTWIDMAGIPRAIDLTHDAMGRLSSIRRPWASGSTEMQAPVEQRQYDALGRLTRVEFNVLGAWQPIALAHSAAGNPKSVISPSGVRFDFNTDGFGQLWRESNPDSGETHRLYDNAGNLLSVTDARGVTTQHTYDALNRRIRTERRSAQDPGSSEDIRHVWDNNPGSPLPCSHGIGRLCRIDDAAGSRHFAYDAFGNLSEQWTVELGQTHRQTFQWDAEGRLIAMSDGGGASVLLRDGDGHPHTVQATVGGGAPTRLVARHALRASGEAELQQLGNNVYLWRSFDSSGAMTGVADSAWPR